VGPDRPPLTRAAVARVALAAVPVTFLAVFFVLPVGTVLATGFAATGGHGLDPAPLLHVIADPVLRGVVVFSFAQAVLSTLLTLLVGLPAAWVFARFTFPGRELLRAATLLPFVLPTVVVGSAFIALLGPRSPLNDLVTRPLGLPALDLRHTLPAILVAHVFYNVPLVIRLVGARWETLDPRVAEAARVLGASRLAVARQVVWPALRPAILGAAAVVFLFTFGSFGVILILGGPGFATVEVEVYRRALERLDLTTAAALAVAQMLVVTAVLLLAARAAREPGSSRRIGTPVSSARRPVTTERGAVVGVLAVLAILLWVPLLVLVERSLAVPGGYALDAYRDLGETPRRSALFVPPLEAIRNSLLFGLAAATLAVVIAGTSVALLARRSVPGRLLDLALALPLATPAVALGLGFLLALDAPPLDLRTAPVLVPLAHALIAVPLVVRVALPVVRAVPPRLREAAAVLGASPRRVFLEVDLRVAGRALAVGAALAFAVSLGEFGATSFIARPETPTLTLAIFRLLSQPGATTFGQAMALATILLVLTTVVALLAARVRLAPDGGAISR
jgi:thiamine transport system permease protein